MFGDHFTFIVIGIGFAVVAVQLVRYGSPSGAMFGSRSEGELGRVDGRGCNRVTVAVHALAEPTDARVPGPHN